MADNSGIEWTDSTWNPITGCTKVSAGCDHCYAETLAERFRGTPGHYFENGFDVQLRPDKLDQPLRWKRPRRIFVNSMSDLFHDQVPDEYIEKVFAVMALAPQHTFQVLTKRHGRMRSLLSSEAFRHNVAVAASDRAGEAPFEPCPTFHQVYDAWPWPNVWLGVSVENQQWADIRVPALLGTPAAVRFLSCEPLLGPVTFRWAKWAPLRGANHLDGLRGIHWVIVGGESGRGARSMHPDWARAIRDECAEAGVPFLFKQWGDGALAIDKHGDIWTPGSDGLMHTPETAPFPREHVERKWGPLKPVSNKAAGRELDGRTWDEYPADAEAAAS